MKKLLLILVPLLVLTFFSAPKALAVVCDYPSLCNTYWSTVNDNDPTPGSTCDIPNLTDSQHQYVFGKTNICVNFGDLLTTNLVSGKDVGRSASCVPKCGFFGRGWCCDPISPGNKVDKIKLTPVPIPPPCAQKSGSSCASVNTAIGTLSTSVDSLVNQIFRILLSLSGGIAVLLIIAAGYQLAASQGNPEKVKEARERLTAAIVGLLFIIFSVTILQIIGVDILRLPGFGK